MCVAASVNSNLFPPLFLRFSICHVTVQGHWRAYNYTIGTCVELVPGATGPLSCSWAGGGGGVFLAKWTVGTWRGRSQAIARLMQYTVESRTCVDITDSDTSRAELTAVRGGRMTPPPAFGPVQLCALWRLAKSEECQ